MADKFEKYTTEEIESKFQGILEKIKLDFSDMIEDLEKGDIEMYNADKGSYEFHEQFAIDISAELSKRRR